MIEINLLPGARKKKGSSGGSSLDVRALVASLGERFRDPWMGVAVGGAAIGLLAIGGMFYLQREATIALAEQERVAVQDSTRFEGVLRSTRDAAAQRDSILRQMAIISAIDGDRFIWPHVMDEIARALPTYTWLQSVSQTNAATTVSPEAVAAGIAPRLSIRLVGLTVDVQALTIFMKQLEASEFLESVTLAGSDATTVEGKQVTEFTLDMAYSKPPESAVRLVPLSIAVR